MDEIRLAATVDNLGEVLDFIDVKLEDMGCPVKHRIQIDIAVEEMFVNVAHYAYGKDGGDVIVMAGPDEDNRGIMITLVDNGMEYNPLAKPDPDITLSVEERQIGGLGIFMVKKSMDKVSYEYRDGYNRFTMVKFFDV